MRTPLMIIFLVWAVHFPAYADQPLLKLDTIILNPDGGGDNFALRPQDGPRREFCFKLAQAIKEAIEKQNGTSVKVVFTATPDNPSGQKDRAYIANSNHGKVYLSIHADDGFSDKPRGLGIYVALPPDSDLPSWKDAGRKYLTKSSLLAEKLKTALDGFYPNNRFFLGKGPITSLYGVAMPAVAVEVQISAQQSPPSVDPYGPLASAFYAGLAEYDKQQ